MKKNYIIIIALFFLGSISAQEIQKNFINYQGVARNADNELMAGETMVIGIALKIGGATMAPIYLENHTINTDANGVFSLKIGNGDITSGNYNAVPWGSGASFITVSVNGSEIGTTEMMAVPYAISSGDGAQQADDVPYDNTTSGLAATDAQAAIDELATSGLVDTDDQDLSLIGTTLQITDGTGVDLAPLIPPGGTDDQNATEVPFDNTTSGLIATDAQAAIDELATSGLVDTDDQNLSLTGTTLQITDGTGVDLAPLIPPGGTDDQNATEVPFDNTTSGLIATDAQAAIDELATSGLVDTDNQDLSLSGSMLQITDGTGVDLAPLIPPGGTDDQNATEVPFDNTTSGLIATDAQAAIDELATSGLVDTDNQDLSLSGSMLQITDGTGVDLAPLIPSGSTDDQNLVLTGDVLSIENGNGSVDLSTYAGDDADADPTNEIDVTAHSGLLLGDGAAVTGLEGTANGQVPKWDASTNTWAAGTDATGGGGSSLWTENGDDIYFNTGNVGIGTTTPTTNFEVAGEGSVVNRLTGNSASLQFFKPGNENIDWTFDVGSQIQLSHSSTDFMSKTFHTFFRSDGSLEVVGALRSRDLRGVEERNVMANANGDLVIGNATPILFKVEGVGFAAKDLDLNSSIETDVWGDVIYDTSNSFNLTTKRFVVPETGFYFLHAKVDQSNFNAPQENFFIIKFNVISSWADGTSVAGDNVDTEISGIYRLTAGQEVFVELRNYSSGLDVRIDGYGSFFEGYKIN